MESPTPQHHSSSSSSPFKRAIDELHRGRELAFQLQLALSRSSSSSLLADSAISVLRSHNDLVVKILGSFDETLAILDCAHQHDEVISQLPPVNSHSVNTGRKSEDSGESCKLSATSKDRRGCYKRRKTTETWTKETSNLIDDGHAWRKYGQKVILHAQHPRNYFRCTHKFDQQCLATKQVQMIQANPPLYRITYHGHHTCKNPLKAPQLILDITSTDSSVLLSFDQHSNNNNDQNCRSDTDSFMAAFPLTKQETKEEVQSFFHNDHNSSSYHHHHHYFLSSDPITAALSPGSDHGDVLSSGVYSCSTSTHSLGMDMGVGSVDHFDDVLQFEF